MRCDKYFEICDELLICEHDHERDNYWRAKEDPRAGMHYVFWPGSQVVKFAWPDEYSAPLPSWPGS